MSRNNEASANLAEATKWVVKVGSSLLKDPEGDSVASLNSLCDQVAQLVATGKSVVVVSSGAVAEGSRRLQYKERPTSLHELQAAAAVGQVGLMYAYQQRFERYGLNTGMALLTHDDLSDRLRYLNARTTIETLLSEKVIPIVNENDSVATDEIRFGDNDTLAARVAGLVLADALILLTDQKGLHEKDPRIQPNAPLVDQRSAFDTTLDAMASPNTGSYGRGGMVTKLQAARYAARSGCHTVIADGRVADELLSLAKGEARGTFLTADLKPAVARKQWIAGQLKVRGQIHVDDGACHALLHGGVSLLAIGVIGVRGAFQRGDVVSILNASDEEIGRGLINYNAAETRQIMGHKSVEIEELLGYTDESELIHRDNLALSGL